jgi:hypothetical protein
LPSSTPCLVTDKRANTIAMAIIFEHLLPARKTLADAKV